jgi:hypothetical protein
MQLNPIGEKEAALKVVWRESEPTEDKGKKILPEIR